MNKNLKILSLISLIALTGCDFSVSNKTETSSIEQSSSESILDSSSQTSSSSVTQESSSSLEESSSISSSSEETEPVDIQQVNKVQALNSLRSSLYSDAIKTSDNIGLKTLYNVGVNEEKYEDEVLYPVPSNNVTVYKVSDYNITTNGSDNARNLNNLLTDLKTVSGTKIIKFDSGTYNFASTVNVVGVKDLYIVGNNTKYVLNKWASYITMTQCSNIHINNIEFDMNPSPTIAGTVKSYSYDANGDCDVVLSVFDEFDLSNGAYSSWSATSQYNYNGSYMECSLDTLTNKYSPDKGKNLFYNTTSSDRSVMGMKNITLNPTAHELTVKLSKTFPWDSLKSPTIGTMVSLAFTMYNYTGFLFVECENVYVEGMTCHVTAGMGFRVESGKNFYLNNVKFAQDPKSKRIMTCTADIIHTIALEGDLKITNSLLESSHDDALNIKSFYGKVTSVAKSSREITISQTQNEVAIKFETGDVIDFYDPDTMGFIDRYSVVSSEKNGKNYTVTVDRRPNNIEEGLSAGNDTRSTHMYLHNSIIRNKRNRGILLQTRYSEISNCTFYNVIMGAIQVLSVGDSFREAIVPAEVVLKNNKLIECRGGDISVFAYGTTGSSIPGTIKNITISNNFLYNNNSNPFWLRSVTDSTLTNNLVLFNNSVTRDIVTNNQVTNCKFADNYCYVNGNTGNIRFIASDNASSNNEVSNNLISGGSL